MPVGVDEDVLWLEVAVEDHLGVAVVHDADHLHHDEAHLEG